MYHEQAKIISKRFREKGYPKGPIEDAYHKASVLTQEQCLTPKNKILNNTQERVNCITSYNKSFTKIQEVFRKHWHVLTILTLRLFYRKNHRSHTGGHQY